MHLTLRNLARKSVCALLGAAAIAGCHNNNTNSGYGIAWVTLADSPGDFTSYIVNVDSVTLTRSDGAVVTAIATPETVDFAQLTDYSELWASAPIPDGTYVSASITIDYTSAVISVLVNGAPVAATVVGPGGAAVTTVAVTVTLDPNQALVVSPSYGSTHAERLALDFHPSASTVVNLSTSPPTVTVNPYFTAAVAPPDNKLIRIRGPMSNSSATLGTYSVYVRPFHDEVNSLGQVTIFNSADTVYTIDGTTYVGAPGIGVLSQLSAGVTVTAAYTTLTPTVAPPSGSPFVAGTAGIFNSSYVIAGNSLENGITQRLTGLVTARSGNTLTLEDSTLSVNTGAFSYEAAPTTVLVDNTTTVTEDGQATAAPLTAASIGVGQHIEALGVYELPASGVTTLDATGASGNSGTVRLQQTQLFGQLVTGAAGSLALNLQAIDGYPVGAFNFAGNGASAAQNPVPASFSVNTGAFDASALPAGTPLWINGIVDAFGGAPPDFAAVTGGVVQEASEPASLIISWSNGTTTPFTSIVATGGDAGLVMNLTNLANSTAFIQVGPENIGLLSLAASPTIVPSNTPPVTTGTFPSFLPAFSLGTSAAGITMHNDFPSFATALGALFAAGEVSVGTVYFEARGTFNRATNKFTADSINVVL